MWQQMIKFTFYRWFSVMLGARSFKKLGNDNWTYAIARGDSNKLANILISQGFTEEWPRNRTMEEDNG